MEPLNDVILNQLKPFFYLVGLLAISQLGALIKYLVSRSEKREAKIEQKIDNISDQLVLISQHIIKLETKMELHIEHSQKDLNNIGQKLRDLNS